jgi:hypothetical protein
MADDHWSDRLVLGGLLSRVLVDFLRFVAIISGIVLAAGPAQAISDTALLGAYCAAFWQSIVDDYEELIQGLPSSPPQGLQDGVTEARRELKRALDYKIGAMTQHIAVPDLIELLVAENQAGDDYRACAQITQHSIQRLLKDPDVDRKVLLQERQAEQRAAPSCQRIKRCQETNSLPF